MSLTDTRRIFACFCGLQEPPSHAAQEEVDAQTYQGFLAKTTQYCPRSNPYNCNMPVGMGQEKWKCTSWPLKINGRHDAYSIQIPETAS